MALDIFFGLVIGFVARDWFGRFIIPFFVGLWSCVELFLALRKKPISGLRKSEFLKVGMSKSEIEGINRVLRMSFRESGVDGWKIYVQQFLFSTITTLAFSLLGGIVKAIFFNRL